MLARDLTRLTTRADDNHAPLVTSVPKVKTLISLDGQRDVKTWGLLALLRIKPHAPPLSVGPSVNSFEFQPCGRTPQAGVLNALAAALSPGK